ncbi:MAG TPA: hypothetical protein VFQ44_18350 [Streptosporangiaceae bacterium]|nr:hypothetical protein [Streptosporangiaceae bacterium]
MRDRCSRLVDTLTARGVEVPRGLDLLWQATSAVVGDGNWKARVLKPSTTFALDRVSVEKMRKWSGGENPSFTASLDRLADFAAARPVTHVMGCHIEMSRGPRRDYPLGSRYQPDEPPLQMTVAQLTAVRDAARSVAAKRGAHTFDDFIIYNGPCRGAIIRQLVRGNWRRLARREAAAP